MGQTNDLPSDFRQHNLSTFNSSLWNPAFSPSRNRPASIALWTRWQWQAIDADPSSIFLNYTGNLNSTSTVGLGFIQHNTGVFLQTGGVANYAHRFNIADEFELAVGLNVFGFQSEVTDDAFVPDEEVGFLFGNENDFIVQMAPGFQLMLNGLSLGFSVGNLVDYNFTAKESVHSGKNYLASLGYEIPITFFGNGDDSYIRPLLYMKTVPDVKDQYGAMALISSPKYWGQVGYNNFYGISAGAGTTIFTNISLGVLAEFGIDEPASSEVSSIELIAAFTFGKKQREQLWSQEKFEDTQAEYEKKEAARRERELELLGLEEERRVADSLEQIKIAEAKAKELKEQMGKTVTQGRYEEVVKQQGLEPGYYLIANVFGTKKYFENFMATLTKQGLEPKSFYRQNNKYNYVYLRKYDSLKDAEKARDNKFDGKYKETTWIFRVIGE
ncbi:MAG: PorP/SprF family type IX secretion system membrane protein [Sediminicola sp.]